MSSSVFVAEIRTSSALRCAVVTSGLLLTAVAVVCSAWLPVTTVGKGLLVATSAGFGIREIAGLRRAYMSYRYIRVWPGGSVELISASGTAIAAELLPGSVLLARLGWLRLRSMSGRRFAELVNGDARRSKDWRRLHVIWRHL